jgi:peptide/nickel transport system permease protein
MSATTVAMTAPSGASRNWSIGFMIAAGAVAIVALAGMAAPWLTGNSPLDQDLLALNKGPSAEYLLGTDHLGRDIWARLLYGARFTFGISMAGTLIAFLIGAGLGLIAMSLGRWTEGALYAGIDLIRALPGTLLALLLIVGLGSGTGPLIVALGISFAPLVAYVARAAFHREAVKDYAHAAASFGGGRMHVLKRHIMPNIIGALVTQVAIILPRCIVTESVLSFLGIGSSPDTPTWGRMIADSSRFIETAPHAIMIPVVALVILTVCLSILGNHLRRWLDPVREQAVEASEPAEIDPQLAMPR